MPNAILLDWNMPVMNGIDFCGGCARCSAAMRRRSCLHHRNDLAHIQEALSAGANEYIMKPFDSDIIQTKFAQIGLI